MSKAKQTLTQAFLERISRGAVPMGGFYSVDPKDLRALSETVKAAEKARPAQAQKAAAHGLYAAAAGERS